MFANPRGRCTVLGVRALPLACRDCGFESRRKQGRLSVVTVVCCQAKVSATGRSLVQRNPIDCGVRACVCMCVIECVHVQPSK